MAGFYVGLAKCILSKEVKFEEKTELYQDVWQERERERERKHRLSPGKLWKIFVLELNPLLVSINFS